MVHKVEKQKILHLDLMKKDFGGIVNASRSLICAYKSPLWSNKFKEEEFGKATMAEAIRMRDELNEKI